MHPNQNCSFLLFLVSLVFPFALCFTFNLIAGIYTSSASSHKSSSNEFTASQTAVRNAVVVVCRDVI